MKNRIVFALFALITAPVMGYAVATPLPPPPPDQSSVSSKLTTVKTGDSVPQISGVSGTYNNLASITAAGSSQFNFQYKFNSGEATAFRVLDVSYSYVCHGFAGRDTISTVSYTLANSQSSTSINILKTISLQPNTDYTLGIQVTGNCPNKAFVSVDPLAWADIADATAALPTSVYDCTGNGSSGPKRLIIFVNGAPYSILSADSFAFQPGGYSAKNLAVYMNKTTFCGQKVDVSSIDLDTTTPSYLSFPQNISATDTAGNSWLLYIQDYGDFINKTGTVVSCNMNDKVVGGAALPVCSHIVADAAYFENVFSEAHLSK